MALEALAYRAEKKQNVGALKELKALEAKVRDKSISKADCTDFCTKWGLGLPKGGKATLPKQLRTTLEATRDNLVRQGELDGESAVLETILHLELEAFDALSDDEKKGVTIRVAKNTYGCT